MNVQFNLCNIITPWLSFTLTLKTWKWGWICFSDLLVKPLCCVWQHGATVPCMTAQRNCAQYGTPSLKRMRNAHSSKRNQDDDELGKEARWPTPGILPVNMCHISHPSICIQPDSATKPNINKSSAAKGRTDSTSIVVCCHVALPKKPFARDECSPRKFFGVFVTNAITLAQLC